MTNALDTTWTNSYYMFIYILLSILFLSLSHCFSSFQYMGHMSQRHLMWLQQVHCRPLAVETWWCWDWVWRRH